jgi:OFA family oxalate/formate antiporter-like MFS transporter
MCLLVVFACALAMRNPPEGYTPAGHSAAASRHGSPASRDFTLQQALGTWQWYALWLTLFLNTTAGIAIISQASPMAGSKLTGLVVEFIGMYSSPS